MFHSVMCLSDITWVDVKHLQAVHETYYETVIYCRMNLMVYKDMFYVMNFMTLYGLTIDQGVARKQQ